MIRNCLKVKIKKCYCVSKFPPFCKNCPNINLNINTSNTSAKAVLLAKGNTSAKAVLLAKGNTSAKAELLAKGNTSAKAELLAKGNTSAKAELLAKGNTSAKAELLAKGNMAKCCGTGDSPFCLTSCPNININDNINNK